MRMSLRSWCDLYHLNKSYEWIGNLDPLFDATRKGLEKPSDERYEL